MVEFEDKNDEDDNTTYALQAGSSKREKVKTMRKRKCDASILGFGFTFKHCDGYEQPVCLICDEFLATESMKPSKLKRHFESKHAAYANKPKEYFERLLKTSNKEKEHFEKFMTVNEKYLQASYEVSYLIAKNKKP